MAANVDVRILAYGRQDVNERHERPCLPSTWGLRPDLMQLTCHIEISRHSDSKLHYTGCLIRLLHDVHQVSVAFIELCQLVRWDALSVSDKLDMLLKGGQVLCRV